MMTDEMITATLDLIDAIENSEDVSPPIVPAFKKLKRAIPDKDSFSEDEVFDGIRAVLNAADGEFLDKGILTAVRSIKTHMRPIDRKIEQEQEQNIVNIAEAAMAQIESVKEAVRDAEDKERIIQEYKDMEEEKLRKMRENDRIIEEERQAVIQRTKEWEEKQKDK